MKKAPAGVTSTHRDREKPPGLPGRLLLYVHAVNDGYLVHPVTPRNLLIKYCCPLPVTLGVLLTVV